MHKAGVMLVGSAAIAAAVAAGYWWGAHPRASAPVAAAPAKPADGEAKGRILYYRNPMGLADTSPTPKKDSMGMDYIPVYEGEQAQGPGVRISLDRVQKLGVRTEPAASRAIARTIRALGTIQVDERSQRTVSPRFEGWIQRLHVNATGDVVRAGQPLMEIYGPDLVAVQQEYLVAVRGAAELKDASPDVQANMRNLVEASLQRLRNWGIAEEEIAQLRTEGKPRSAITLRAPAGGVVLEKPAVQGMRFMPGEVLYRIADLSSVWLLAEVFERDLGAVRVGQAVKVRVNAYPGQAFEGKVAFLYPTVTAETRTAKVRIEMPNPGQRLKPAMYASVEIAAGGQDGRRLAVPDSAVLDSGTRQVVLVRRGEGLFEPREVKLGERGDGYVEVLEGVKDGEEIVVSANFLIDAESNLKAAIGGFGHAAHGAAPKPAAAGGASHAAEGTVDGIDPKAGMVSIAHGPVPSLKWPAMTMEFKVRDPALLGGLKVGERIRFEFAEPAPGEWTVTRATPAAAPAGAPAAAHKGH